MTQQEKEAFRAMLEANNQKVIEELKIGSRSFHNQIAELDALIDELRRLSQQRELLHRQEPSQPQEPSQKGRNEHEKSNT